MEARVAEEQVLYVVDNPTHKPHDKFFHAVMSDKRVARDFLQSYLPHDIAEVVDFDNLEIQPRSYLSKLKKESTVDMLFKTTISNKEALIYILVEHQSSPDPLMPFRILQYVVNIINNYLDKNKQKKLPLIYPMVVYHHDAIYPYSTDIVDLVDAPRDLAEKYFLKPFQLIDLGQITDEEIKQHAWSGIAEFALKYIFKRDMLPHVKKIFNLMRHVAEQGGERYLETVLEYVIEQGEVGSQKDFIELIKKDISTEVGEKIMTLRELFLQEGLDKGLQQGMQQGMQQGIQEEKTTIAKRMLAQKLDIALIAEVTQLPIATIKQLEEKSH